MSNSSDSVKRWRKNTKQRIIDSLGGRCVCCGYNKCNDALAIHHLNPEIKEISFGGIRANPKKWSEIANELKNCVLLCHVCHSEVHANMREIPKESARFNEAYTEYRLVSEQTFCPVCGNEKNDHQKTCSKNCAAKLSRKVDWDKFNLEEMMRTMKLIEIAEIIGVSDSAVNKRLKKLKLK